jgi:hypothetical protein
VGDDTGLKELSESRWATIRNARRLLQIADSELAREMRTTGSHFG